MGAADFIVHLLNFVAPAVFIALLVTLVARVLVRKQAVAPAWYAQAAINLAACIILLLAGLWYFGRDGTIASYAAMVLGCATSQWWMLRKI